MLSDMPSLLRQQVEMPQCKQDADNDQEGRADLGIVARRVIARTH